MKQTTQQLKNVLVIIVLFCFCNISTYAQSNAYHHTTFIVSSSQSWDANNLPINENVTADNGVLRIENQLIITSGNSLNIASSVQLEFGENARITVESGAELIVDGAVLTKASDAPWFGIEVLGNSHLRQTEINQGEVDLLNGALIQYAIKGVSLIGHNSALENVWGTTGGVLHAEQAQFKNCLQAVEFMSYTNTNEQGLTIRNESYVNNSSILVDETINTVFLSGSLIGVSLWEVDGIVISSCNFVNSIPKNSTGIFRLHNGQAIISYDSNFSLRAVYLGEEPIVEINEDLFVRNTIEGFDIGVDVYGMGDLTSTCIDRTDFINSRVGLLLRNTKSTVVSGNHFEVPLLTSSLSFPKDISTVGAHIKNSSRYIVEANSFVGVNENGFKADDLDAGLIIESSSSWTEDRIFGNQFDKLSYAIMVYGENGEKNNYGSSGLDFRFNDFGFNTDFGVNTQNLKDIYLYSDATIDAIQGIISADPMDAAGNRFQSKNTVNGHIEISNPDFTLDYYYHQNDSDCVPENSAVESVVNSEGSYSFTQGRSYSGYNEPPAPLPFKGPYPRVQLDEIQYNYTLLEDNFKEILNGGIKPEIMDMLLTDLSSSSDIYQKMSLGSPYLSDDVLISAITRTNPISQWHLTELLVRNGPLSPKVMKAFDQIQPLTAYLASLVYNNDGNSQRHLLELEMKSLREDLAVRKAQYIHTVLFDESLPNGYQDLYDLFEEVGSPEELRVKIEALIKLEAYGEALSLLNEYQIENTDNYSEFKLIQLALKQDGLNWFQLTNDQLANIEELAEDTAFGAEYAKAVLNLITQDTIEAYSMPIADAQEMRIMNGTPDYKKVDRSIMTIAPNPARDDVYISYELPEEYNNAVLEVHNIMGQNVAQYNLGSFRNVYKINCNDYTTGVYLINLIVDGSIVETSQLNIVQ